MEWIVMVGCVFLVLYSMLAIVLSSIKEKRRENLKIFICDNIFLIIAITIMIMIVIWYR